MLCPIFKQFLKLYFFDSNSSVTPCVHLFNRQTKVFIGMKKGKIYLVLFVLLFTGISQLAAQEKRMTRKEKEAAWRAERMKKRALEEREVAHNDSVAFMQAVNALKNGSWALEASNVTFDNGVTRFVTESTNFVSVNEGQGVVQTAFGLTATYGVYNFHLLSYLISFNLIALGFCAAWGCSSPA